MANVATCSRERFNWAVEVMDKALSGEEVEARDAFGAGAILCVVGEAAFGLAEEVERLSARLDALIQVAQAVQPFINQKYIVSELRAAVDLAKGEPSPDSHSYDDEAVK